MLKLILLGLIFNLVFVPFAFSDQQLCNYIQLSWKTLNSDTSFKALPLPGETIKLGAEFCLKEGQNILTPENSIVLWKKSDSLNFLPFHLPEIFIKVPEAKESFSVELFIKSPYSKRIYSKKITIPVQKPEIVLLKYHPEIQKYSYWSGLISEKNLYLKAEVYGFTAPVDQLQINWQINNRNLTSQNLKQEKNFLTIQSAQKLYPEGFDLKVQIKNPLSLKENVEVIKSVFYQ